MLSYCTQHKDWPPKERLICLLTQVTVLQTANSFPGHIIFKSWCLLYFSTLTVLNFLKVKDPKTKKTPKCCEGSRHPNCLPIEIPDYDPFYRYSFLFHIAMNSWLVITFMFFNCYFHPGSTTRSAWTLSVLTRDWGTTAGSDQGRASTGTN